MNFIDMNSIARSLVFGGAFLISLAATFYIFYEAEGSKKEASGWKWAGILSTGLTFPALVFSALKTGNEMQNWINPLGTLGIVGLIVALLDGILYITVGQDESTGHYQETEVRDQSRPEELTENTVIIEPEGPPPPVRAYLMMIGPNKEKAFRLGSKTLIGRKKSYDITLDDKSVSKSHARINFIQDKNVFVYNDLASANGSWLVHENRKMEIKKEHILQQGDVLELGETHLTYLQIEN